MTARDGDPDAGTALDRATGLLTDQRFAAARAAFEQLVGTRETAEAQEGLAVACRSLDDIPAAMAAYERAYRLRIAGAQPAAAARVACLLADIELSALGRSAVAAGWLSRARDHLRGAPDNPVHVDLEALSAYRALPITNETLTC